MELSSRAVTLPSCAPLPSSRVCKRNSYTPSSRHAQRDIAPAAVRHECSTGSTAGAHHGPSLDIQEPQNSLLQSELEVFGPELPTGQVASLLKTILLSAASAGAVLAPMAVHAAEVVPDGFFEVILRTVESLGPLGPVAFVAAVSIAESVPFLPTQPLSLASGLLFGAQTGAVCMITGTTLAALIAFTVARGFGRPLAERIIRAEMRSETKISEAGGELGPVQVKLQEVQLAIEKGTFWQQAGAVTVLRLTPIIPFSASNYVLGISPLPVAPYLLGTVTGMAFWSVMYASLGGASRALLRRGADPDALMGDLLSKVTSITEEVGVAALVAAGVAAAGYLLMHLRKRLMDGGDALAEDR